MKIKNENKRMTKNKKGNKEVVVIHYFNAIRMTNELIRQSLPYGHHFHETKIIKIDLQNRRLHQFVSLHP